MLKMTGSHSFLVDFASPADWAAMYRRVGFQVVPCHMPQEGTSWKRPMLADWKTFQNELVPDPVFARWYGQGGEHTRRPNMGVITGRASGNIFVIDLDTYAKPEAAQWWDRVIALNNFGSEPETWEQRTGGGGIQKFFRAPADWTPPTNKTSIGVDIRGQGGFAVIPPSIHSSGNEYTWREGYEPWMIPVEDAPEWLLGAIEELVEQHGGHQPGERHERTASPSSDFNSFGRRIDGREDYMTKVVWGAMVDWRREAPEDISDQARIDRRKAAFDAYARNVKPRIDGPGTPEDRLEREGRGWSAFCHKWAYAFAKWEGKVARDAAERPRQQPKPEAPRDTAAPSDLPIATVDFLTLMTEDVVEEPDYIEPDFAGPGGFVLIAGPPKAQKSFLLQEMLVAAATGDRFLCGTFNTPRPLRVFYLQAEMNRKLLRKRAREMSFLTSAQRGLLQANLIVSERFHMILDDNGVDVAVATIKAAFPDAPPDIIAVDPMANVFDQENENDNAQVMRFLNGRLQAVRQRVNPLACVVLVHHATKKSTDDMARDPFVAVRGAGALRGYYDSAIVIYREGEESRSRKVHFELRGGESPEPMSVELAGGRFQKANEGASIDRTTARKILEAMQSAWARKAPWSPHARAKSEGRWAIYNASTMFSIPPKAVQWLLDEWLKNGVVTFRPLAKREHPAGLEVTGSID